MCVWRGARAQGPGLWGRISRVRDPRVARPPPGVARLRCSPVGAARPQPAGEGECARGGRRAAGPGEPRVGAAPPSPGPGRKRAGLQRGLPASAPARPPARPPPASLLGRLPGRRARGGPARCLGPGQVRVGGGTRRSPSPRPPPRLLRRAKACFGVGAAGAGPRRGATRGKVNPSGASRGRAARARRFRLSPEAGGRAEAGWPPAPRTLSRGSRRAASEGSGAWRGGGSREPGLPAAALGPGPGPFCAFGEVRSCLLGERRVRAAPGGSRGRGSSRGCPRPRPGPASGGGGCVGGAPRAVRAGGRHPPRLLSGRSARTNKCRSPCPDPERVAFLAEPVCALGGPRESGLGEPGPWGRGCREVAAPRGPQHRCCLRGSPLSRCTAPPAGVRGLSSRRCDPGLTTRRSQRTALCRVAGSSGSEPGVPRCATVCHGVPGRSRGAPAEGRDERSAVPCDDCGRNDRGGCVGRRAGFSGLGTLAGPFFLAVGP